MELKDWTYDEFPEFEYDGADGILQTTGDEVGVTYIPDIVYAEVDGVQLHLQIQYPHTRNCPDGVYPCIVFIKGSAWKKQNCYESIPMLTHYAERGFVIATVEYRHSGIAGFPACVIDARNAVRFIKKNAELYHIDPEKIILAGGSSGGHTAIFGGILQDDHLADNLYPGYTADVKCIVDFYGSTSFMAEDSNPTTTDHCGPGSPEGLVMGGVDLNENPELKRALSVECNIDEQTVLPPVLIIHGTKDRIVNASCSAVVYEQLKKTGHEAYLYLLKGADHGGPEFYAKNVVDTVTDFIRKCL